MILGLQFDFAMLFKKNFFYILSPKKICKTTDCLSEKAETSESHKYFIDKLFHHINPLRVFAK